MTDVSVSVTDGISQLDLLNFITRYFLPRVEKYHVLKEKFS